MTTLREIIERDGWTNGTHRHPDSGAACIITAVDAVTRAGGGRAAYREHLLALHQAMAESPGARTAGNPEGREDWELAELVISHNDRRVRSQEEALEWARSAQRIMDRGLRQAQ
jgi:hypothetical protein